MGSYPSNAIRAPWQPPGRYRNPRILKWANIIINAPRFGQTLPPARDSLIGLRITRDGELAANFRKHIYSYTIRLGGGGSPATGVVDGYKNPERYSLWVISEIFMVGIRSFAKTLTATMTHPRSELADPGRHSGDDSHSPVSVIRLSVMSM